MYVCICVYMTVCACTWLCLSEVYEFFVQQTEKLFQKHGLQEGLFLVRSKPPNNYVLSFCFRNAIIHNTISSQVCNIALKFLINVESQNDLLIGLW